MLCFLGGIVLLIVGYFTYGKLVERLLGPDDRETPAVRNPDGVDYVILPKWKNMLIQLLNIAGIGPVIGVILGIKFGSIVFFIIPIGNILGGAVHDFIGGMMSLRDNGANLPTIVRKQLGIGYYRFFSWFMILLLLLVVAVFINIPAKLCDGLVVPDSSQFWIFVSIIFLYYVVATMFPIDKIIGKIYPVFGLMLLVGTFAIFVSLFIAGVRNPEILQESEAFRANMFTSEHAPVLPLLFVTIACGIMSGFHATQSPIVARTMRSEREARITFYGMMITEGIIAMVWAGAGLAIYNLFPEMMSDAAGTATLLKITDYFLGSWMGVVTVLAVVILAVTSGDTALRSTRLSLAEMIRVEQTPLMNRALVCVPLIAVVGVLLFWSNLKAESFKFLWNYFAWGNQVLAASTLMAGTVWLMCRRKPAWIAIVPGMFMTFIVVTFILWTSTAHGQPYGFGLDIGTARMFGIFAAFLFLFWACFRAHVLTSSKCDRGMPPDKD